MRTNAPNVRSIMGKDYDGTSNLAPYIATANAIVTRVAACARLKGKTLTVAELELIERWLAAHYYTKHDPVYASKSEGKASASFVRDPEVPEPYKKAAMEVDYSGCLSAILKRQTAGGTWLGTAQDQYDGRLEP